MKNKGQIQVKLNTSHFCYIFKYKITYSTILCFICIFVGPEMSQRHCQQADDDSAISCDWNGMTSSMNPIYRKRACAICMK